MSLAETMRVRNPKGGTMEVPTGKLRPGVEKQRVPISERPVEINPIKVFSQQRGETTDQWTDRLKSRLV